MRPQYANTVRKCVVAAVVFLSSFGLNANAALDLNQSSCDFTGQELSQLQGTDGRRVIAFAYHNGYLMESIWGDGFLNVYDLANPRAPIVRQSLTHRWAGHHAYVGVGPVLAWNFAGEHQIRLNDLPALNANSKLDDNAAERFMKPAEPRGNRDAEQLSYYPYGFRHVPHAYDFREQAQILIYDQRVDDGAPIGSLPLVSAGRIQGRISMIGNILIVRGDNEQPGGVETYDFSDPANPKHLDTLISVPGHGPLNKAYDAMPFWGNYIVLVNNGETGHSLRAIDLVDYSDPSNLRHVARLQAGMDGFIRYAQFKDNHMFVGDVKVDMSQPNFPVVGRFNNAGGEYLLPVGNLLVTNGRVGTDPNNQNHVSRVFCNDAAVDNTGPSVAYHNPPSGATNLHVKSRVGLLVHETMDLNTLIPENFIIRPVNGDPIPVDVSWMDNDIINVTPRQDLADNTTYEFVIPRDSIKDVAGNGIEETFSFHFSTGPSVHLNDAPVINAASIDIPFARTGQTNQLSIIATDESMATLQFSVDWGDGQISPWSNLSQLNHTYNAPGIYRALITARDEHQEEATRILDILVEDPVSQAHQSSNSLLLDEARDRVVNVNPDNNTVTATSTVDGTRIFEVAVPEDPRSIAMDTSGNYWVTSLDAGSVSLLNGANGANLATIELGDGAQPFGIVIDPNGFNAYVSAMGEGRVYRLDIASRSISDSIYVGPTPRAMALSADGGTLLVTRFISAQDRAEVYRINAGTFTSSVIPLSVDNTTFDSNFAGRGIPNYLMSIAIAPDGNTAWVGSKKDNILRGTSRDGNPLDFQNTVRSIISKIDLNTNQELRAEQFDLDNLELVSAISFSPGGQIVYVANQGNHQVSAYMSHNQQVISRESVGDAPIGIVVDSGSGEVYSHSFLSRSVSHLSLFRGVSQSVGALETINTFDTVTTELLDPEILLGKRVFYDASDLQISRDGYLSCAACHLDGGSDARVWDFTDRGEGLRNTINLAGRAGVGHGRVHWSANFDEIQDFEHDIRNGFSGLGLMRQEDFDSASHPLGNPKAGMSVELDALAVYLASLNTFAVSPHRDENNNLTADAVLGRSVFVSQGCASCHSGANFTDSALGARHDVGTIKASSGQRLGGALSGIDTPTLRGLWESDPYLHDGSAVSLEEVLNNSAHGSSDQLTAEQRAQLVAYLMQIDGLEPAAPGQSAPTVISSISNGQVITLGEVVLSLDTGLTGVSAVEWYVEDQLLDTASTAPFDLSWSPTQSGDYRIYARVIYNSGQTATLTPEVFVRYNAQQPLDNILSSSGTFAHGQENFRVFFFDGGMASSSFNGEANFTVHAAQQETWHVQMSHELAVAQGMQYSICYQASAAASRRIDVNVDTGIAEPGESQGYVGVMPEAAKPVVGTTMQSYRHTFVANRSDGSARLTFNFGLDAADVRLDNIAVYEGDRCSLDGGSADAQAFESIQIEAEDFSHQDGINTEPTQDVGGGENVGFSDPGDFMEYHIPELPSGGNYVFSFRTAGNHGAGSIRLMSVDGSHTYGEFAQAGGTGGWQLWQTREFNVNLPAGLNKFRIHFNHAHINLNWYRLVSDYDRDGITGADDLCPDTPLGDEVDASGCSQVHNDNDNDRDGVENHLDACPATPPGSTVDSMGCADSEKDSDGDGVTDDRDLCAGTPSGRSVDENGCEQENFSVTIQAESFVSQHGVQVEGTSDIGGGQNVGYTNEGDWMRYSRITLPTAGEYRLTYRLAGEGQGAIKFFGNGADRGYKYFYGTGGWQNWTEQNEIVMLPAGETEITLRIDSGSGININWFRLDLVSEAPGNLLSSVGAIPNRGAFNYYLDSGSNASISFDEDVHIQVGTGMAEAWRVQLDHPLNITNGTQYTICFGASAEYTRSINVNIDSSSPEYRSLIPDDGQNIYIDNYFRQYQYTFTPNETMANARLVFSLGDSSADVRLDNIGVYPGTSCGVP